MVADFTNKSKGAIDQTRDRVHYTEFPSKLYPHNRENWSLNLSSEKVEREKGAVVSFFGSIGFRLQGRGARHNIMKREARLVNNPNKP